MPYLRTIGNGFVNRTQKLNGRTRFVKLRPPYDDLETPKVQTLFAAVDSHNGIQQAPVASPQSHFILAGIAASGAQAL